METIPAIAIALRNLSHPDPSVRCHADWYLEYKRHRTLRSLRCCSNQELRRYAARELVGLRRSLTVAS